MSVTLKLLGKARLKHEDEWLEPALGKPFCLLAYLAYNGSWLSREELAFIFWPDMDDGSARRNLRQLLNRAKRLPFSTGLELETTRLAWRIDTDIAAFRKAIGKQAWAEACKFYEGPLLEGLSFSDGSGFETWLELERETLANAWQDALLNYTIELEERGDYQTAVTYLSPLVKDTLVQEEVLQQYLRLAYLAGLRQQALAIFESFAQRLKEDLNLEPLEETLQLVEQIRAAEVLTPAFAPQPNERVPLSVLRPPRLIGRDKELGQIRESTHTAFLIAGEAGAGKSRLAQHLAPNALVLRAHEGMEQIPYYPVAAFIRERLSRGETLPDLQQYREDLVRLVPEIAPDLAPRAADPETGQERLLEALARLFEALAPKTGRFTLLIDDLQWLDEASFTLYLYLLKRSSLGMIATCRSYEVSEALRLKLAHLKGQQQLAQIDLEPLGTEAIAQLLADLMQEEQGPPLFSQWLSQKSGGNPMFALELLKTLFESGMLKQDSAGWHTAIDSLTQDYSELEVPEVVAEVIQRRLRHLSHTSSRVLQVAAVIGRDFAPDLLAQISGFSTLEVIDALDEAEQRGLIEAEQFHHDLIRQSIYRALSSSRRRHFHAQVAEQLGPETDPALRAEHYFSAERFQKAAEAWQLAAASYETKGLFKVALGFLERAYTYSPVVKDKREILVHRATVLQRGGFNQEARALIDELLNQDLETSEQARVLNTKAVILLREGQISEAADLVDQCFQLGRTVRDHSFQTSFLMTQSILLHAQNRFDEVVSVLENALAKLRKHASAEDLATVLTSLAASYDMLAEHEKALPLHQEALAIARAHGLRYFQIDAAINLLYCLMDLGRSQEAIPVAEETLELGLFENSPTLRTNLATAYFELEDYATAKQHYEQVLKETEHVQLRALALARLAETYHILEIDKVEEMLEQAYEAVEQASGQIYRARVLIVTLKFGSASQKERVRPWLQAMDWETLPGYLTKELELAMASG